MLGEIKKERHPELDLFVILTPLVIPGLTRDLCDLFRGGDEGILNQVQDDDVFLIRFYIKNGRNRDRFLLTLIPILYKLGICLP